MAFVNTLVHRNKLFFLSWKWRGGSYSIYRFKHSKNYDLLLGLQGKTNIRIENKRRKLNANSFMIIDAIKEISKGVKEIENMKMEMIERITT